MAPPKAPTMLRKSVSDTMLPALPQKVVQLRFDDRGDPWWHPDKPWLLNLLRLPYRTYKQLFHYSRPDTTNKIIRQAEWQHIHSEWRYVHSLFVYLGRPSRILWKVKIPLTINMLVAVSVVLAIEKYPDQKLLVPTFAHEAVIQMFSVTTFVLALLMALRHNRTYERWWDAWRKFRRMGDCAVALTQLGTVYCAHDPRLQAEVARWAVLWCYSMVQFCSDAAALDPMAARLLSDAEKAMYNAAPNKFSFVELKLRKLLHKMGLPVDQSLAMDEYMREGFRCVRGCSTIKQTALPYALTLMCTGFIEIALILLPIGFIGRPYRTLVPHLSHAQHIAAAILLLGLYLITNLLMLGGDEVAAQLEDPFKVLPLCDRTEGVVDLIKRTFDESYDFDELEALQQPSPILSGYAPKQPPYGAPPAASPYAAAPPPAPSPYSGVPPTAPAPCVVGAPPAPSPYGPTHGAPQPPQPPCWVPRAPPGNTLCISPKGATTAASAAASPVPYRTGSPKPLEPIAINAHSAPLAFVTAPPLFAVRAAAAEPLAPVPPPAPTPPPPAAAAAAPSPAGPPPASLFRGPPAGEPAQSTRRPLPPVRLV